MWLKYFAICAFMLSIFIIGRQGGYKDTRIGSLQALFQQERTYQFPPGLNVSPLEFVPSLAFPNEVLSYVLMRPSTIPLQTEPINAPVLFLASPSSVGIDDIAKYIATANSEAVVIQEFKRVLEDPQQLYSSENTGLTPVVLDVGSNSGFYSQLAAVMGYQVVAFDPQPQCAMFVLGAAKLNGIDSRLTILNAFAGSGDGSMVGRRTGCWGTYPNYGPWETGQQGKLIEVLRKSGIVEVGMERVPHIGIDKVMDPDKHVVPLMKVDVEGFEDGVFRSMRKMLSAGRVHNIVCELNKNAWKNFNVTHEDACEMLTHMTTFGYKIHLGLDGPLLFSQKSWDMQQRPCAAMMALGWISQDILMVLEDPKF
ncbi:hypothetical protein SARC_06919 [Sphaeroforma arctica JP610]|uniref:Methyltransferase FkbM domain-containing protein n=1 Tax=Sphaeroforma arctica JP610 TaxID=667725 RepID=A0A0L0FV63_9EUKA|nr:hypothetical protein SARC_06919 [Sphaeroforma arctica JP610]KNC80717.1 hypothetical protein SARC_06919 [Sphaeroforma arctica JP610]|eukprot:XP_014154619.1 hypothetical protein SARC_06919 [Sphaeroforma arctica JP610]